MHWKKLGACRKHTLMAVVLGVLLAFIILMGTPSDTAQSMPEATAHYYLYPHNLHLISGQTGEVPLTVIDDDDNPVAGDVTFYGYDTSLISISPEGYVTALRTEDDIEIGTWVQALVNGVPVHSTAIVRVLSSDYGVPFSRIVGEQTILYYPTVVHSETLSLYVDQYQIPTVNEYAYDVQHLLMDVQPFNGARQIFEIDFGESETQRVCGISGNPIRLGWNINGNEWQNCFLVPFIPPRSPQWGVMYHELGHNFTWASQVFALGLGRFEYSEGMATAIGLTTMQEVLDDPVTYPISDDAELSLGKILTTTTNLMIGDFQDWLAGGADFGQLDPNIVDGIWLYYNAQRLDDFAPRFFLPLHPEYFSRLSDLLNDLSEDDQHTIFAALVSMAMGQDLSGEFSATYHYPIDPIIFTAAYESFGRIAREAFPATWGYVVDDPNLAARGMAAAYDAERERVVLFGGMDEPVLSATWEYDGASWYLVDTLHTPPARMWPGMAYDSDRGVMVLFGGQGDGGRLNDTWEYDGIDWTSVDTMNSPSPREGFGMVYDSCRQRILLFGGLTDVGHSVETWEYDGTDWTLVAPSTSPPGRFLTAMAFDDQRCRAILFGGGTDSAGCCDGLGDTWEYNGMDWSQRSPERSPPPRWAHDLAFDSVHGTVILFGGYGPEWPDGREWGDTWEYDGQTWAPLHLEQAPAAREQHVLVYDAGRDCTVLVGGWVASYGLDGETWELRYDERLFLPLVLKGN